MERDVFTTFEAARFCQVHFETIKNWIRRGRLQAYRTPGGHYRISRENLERLMRENNFPVTKAIASNNRARVLVVDEDYSSREKLSETLHLYNSNIDVATAADGYETGEMVSSFKPDLILLNTTISTINCERVVKRIKSNKNTRHTKIIVFTSDDVEQDSYEQNGVDACLSLPVEDQQLVSKIEGLLNI